TEEVSASAPHAADGIVAATSGARARAGCVARAVRSAARSGAAVSGGSAHAISAARGVAVAATAGTAPLLRATSDVHESEGEGKEARGTWKAHDESRGRRTGRGFEGSAFPIRPAIARRLSRATAMVRRGWRSRQGDVTPLRRERRGRWQGA